MPEIISRKEARARGLKRYFTGKVCPHGHTSGRLVSNSYCIACKAEDCRNYAKKYPAKVQASRRAKYGKDRDRQLGNARKWREENHERALENDRKRHRKTADLLSVLKSENPELLKEFGL